MIRPRLVLVDDDVNFCFAFQKALEGYNASIRVTVYNNGAELIEALGQISVRDKPQLILMDLDMPRMNGIETTKAIRQNEQYRAVPILLLTRSEQPSDVEKAYQMGVNAFISKPFSYAEIKQTVQQIGDYWLMTGQLPGGA
ncbi:response regulator [Tellurirhabdus rosea]|uniref:response regulator n=1 Tax=Tellurirhabdus rosea TaxID=2674997 RepID=UPI002259AB33|nr:response regulator [Tellurirhabdus rosea]